MFIFEIIFGVARGVYRVIATIFYLAREGSPILFLVAKFLFGLFGLIYLNAVLMRWIGDLVFVHVEGDFQHISPYGLAYMIPMGMPATVCSLVALGLISDFRKRCEKLKARRATKDLLSQNRRSTKKSKAKKNLKVEQLPAVPKFGEEERLLCKQLACCGVAAFVICMPGMRSYTILAQDGVHQQIWYELNETIVPYAELRELISKEYQSGRTKLHTYSLTYLRNGWLETMHISTYSESALKILKQRSSIEYRSM